MNKKSKIVNSKLIINTLNSYNIIPRVPLLVPIMQKFLNNIMKKGQQTLAEKHLIFLIYYWKSRLKRDFFFDLMLILNKYIWPIILLKVKKHGKSVELPGVLQLEQRWYNLLKQILLLKSQKLLNLTLLYQNNHDNLNITVKHLKKTTFRNIRFLRYRW